jgi:hypothetical protein
MVFVVWIPQLLYWKMITDHYLLFSYSEQSFFWSDPKIIEFLFGFRKGWLLYSPIFLFLLVANLLLFVRQTLGHAILFAVSLINAFICSCWWCWWFGGGYGARPMIEMYPLLIFPIATIIEEIRRKSKTVKLLAFTVLILCSILNILHTSQFHGGSLHHDSMTKKAYFKLLLHPFSKTKQADMESYLEHPNYPNAINGIR